MSNIQKSPISNLKTVLSSPMMQKKLQEVVGKNSSAFATSIVQLASQNDMLSKADPNSIIGAALTAATLNLQINNQIGHAYVVPFNERQKDGSYLPKATFIIGYKGLKQLAIRSGQFLVLNTSDVREGEIEFVDNLTGEIGFSWIQEHDERMSKKIIGYVSHFKLVNGFTSTFYMTVDQMEAHAKKFSQTYKKGFGLWKDDKEKMSLKTISKLHLNAGEAPLSTEMKMAIESDQAVLSANEDENTIDIESYPDNETTKIDPDLERQRMLLDGIKTQDDIDFARSAITDKAIIAELDLIEIQLKKGK